MPKPFEDDKRAMDMLASNQVPADSMPAIMDKLGVDDDDVRAWQMSAKSDPETATKLRNKVFDNILLKSPIEDPDAFSVEQGVRFLAKNFIDQDPQTQINFLKKFGIEAGSDPKAGLYFIDRKKNRRVLLDPTYLDVWDVTDVLTDIVEGVATSAATVAGAGIGGLAGTAGGPLGVLGGAALGGAAGAASVGAGAEFFRQSLALGAGARERLDPGLIGQQAGMSILGVPLDLIGLGTAKRGAKQLAETGAGRAEKEVANLLKEAAATLKLQLTPGMLKQSPLVQRLEASLIQDAGKIGGIKIRKAVQENKDRIQKILGGLFEDAASGVGNARQVLSDVGEKYIQNVKDSIARKLAPAAEVFNKYDKIFDKFEFKNISPDGKSKGYLFNQLKDTLEQLGSDATIRRDPRARTILASVLKEVEDSTNIGDITAVKRFIANSRRAAQNSDPVWNRLDDVLSTRLVEIRNNAMAKAAPAKGLGGQVSQELRASEKIWAETAEEIRNLMGKRLSPLRGGLERSVDTFFKNMNEITAINKAVDVKDPRRIMKLARDFPEAFDIARKGFLADMQNELTKDVAKEGFNVARAVKNIDKIPSSLQNVIFGPDSTKIISAMKLFLKERPEILNPSQTATKIGFENIFRVMASIGEQSASFGKEKLLNRLVARPSDKSALEEFGKMVIRANALLARPALQQSQAGRPEILPQSAMRQPLLIPQR